MTIGIRAVTEHLVTQIKAIAAFSNRVGLTVGGKDIDPINRELPHPSAWIVYIGDEVVSSTPMNPCSTLIKLNFVVKVVVDYGTEANLTTTQFPLLHNVVSSVQGKEPVSGSKWLYDGQVLESLEPNRMVWAQSYSAMIGI